MDYKVTFRETSLEDLEGIVRTIALHNPAAAQRLGETIVRVAESLGFFPERYPKVRQRPGIRRFIVSKHYKVFYRVHGETATGEILRCWNGRGASDPSL